MLDVNWSPQVQPKLLLWVEVGGDFQSTEQRVFASWSGRVTIFSNQHGRPAAYPLSDERSFHTFLPLP